MKINKNFPAFLASLAIFLAWEISSRAGILSELLFPPPSRILAYFWTSFLSGELTSAFFATFMRLIAGFVIGSIPGLGLGWAMGISPRLRAFCDPFVAALYPIPKIAIFPFILLIFGVGEASKLVAVAITTFFPILINTVAGMEQINRIYLQVAQNYGANRWMTFKAVVFPSSLPWILTGARVAINTSFMVVVAVELVSARLGLGVLIWFGWETLNVLKLYGALICIALVGVLLNIIFNWLFAVCLPWNRNSNTIEEYK